MSRLVMALVVVAAVAVACTGDARDTLRHGVGQAREAASDLQEQVEEGTRTLRYCTAALRLARAIDQRDWDTAFEAAEELAEEAPEEIAADARTVAEGARGYRGGDTSAVTDEDFQAAAERVAAFTADRCDPRG